VPEPDKAPRDEKRLTNEEIAYTLHEIGELLDIQGESVFRVQAYDRAATAIRNLARDVADIYDEGGLKALQTIPGVGKSTALKIVEMLQTGKSSRLEELRKSLPPSLVAMSEIPGIGPKKIKRLYDELGVATLEQLEGAAKAGRVRELRGMSAKTEENILKGIEAFRQHHERILLYDAYPVAERVVTELSSSAAVERVDPAGSLRRFKETIGDIDILASSRKAEEVMEKFATLPEVREVVARGPTKSSVRTRAGLQVDLRVVTPDQYGAALQYFTGSKAHNIHLRELAKKRNLKINEYGVFDVETDKRVAGATEEEVYAQLGLPWIPPTLREDKGEIEAAAEGRLPKLIQLEDVRGDLHVHTNWSDGSPKIDEVAEAAIELGYEYVAITDHGYKLGITGGLEPSELERQIKETEEVNRRYPRITILAGSEVSIDNEGKVDFDDDLLARLDIVNASIHAGFNQDRKQLTERTLAAIENPHVDIVCHPTGRLLGRRDAYDIDLDEVFKTAAKHKKVLELNAWPNRLDLKDDYLREAKSHGVRFAISTDSHRLEELHFMFYGIVTAQRGWLGPDDAINTLPLDELKRLLGIGDVG